jgi:hypothetical protein
MSPNADPAFVSPPHPHPMSGNTHNYSYRFLAWRRNPVPSNYIEQRHAELNRDFAMRQDSVDLVIKLLMALLVKENHQ